MGPIARQYRQAALKSDSAQLAKLREQALRAYQATVNLGSLTPPASDQTAFRQYVTATQNFAKVTHEIDAALATRNVSTAQKLDQLIVQAGGQRARAAAALGARACAF
jgi:hypothetical protein